VLFWLDFPCDNFVHPCNTLVTAEAAEAFYALADEKGWVLGEVFERAIMALKRDLEGQERGEG
jgi:hypothetical protein